MTKEEQERVRAASAQTSALETRDVPLDRVPELEEEEGVLRLGVALQIQGSPFLPIMQMPC